MTQETHLPPSKQPKKQQEYFGSWYEQNKERLSEERKAKYAADAEYRAKVKAQSKATRATKPPKPRKKSDKMTLPVLCEKAGCSIHTLRKYQQLGWVPKCSTHVAYTEKHVALLSALCEKAKELIYLRKGRMEILQPYIDNLTKNWFA